MIPCTWKEGGRVGVGVGDIVAVGGTVDLTTGTMLGVQVAGKLVVGWGVPEMITRLGVLGIAGISRSSRNRAPRNKIAIAERNHPSPLRLAGKEWVSTGAGFFPKVESAIFKAGG
jgi:hypothetical protein